MSGPRDERSVGELLLDSEFTARDILFDGPDLQAEPMLRTWGEVVQAGGELWDALPVPKGGAHGTDGEAYMMARLEEMNSSLHRSIRGKSWPGNGSADPRLSTIADNLARAADLVRAAEPNRPNRQATRADLAAAKTRLIHTLYVACHGVGLAVGAHARDLQAHFDAKGWISPTQSLTAVRSAQNRLAAFEQLTGAYVARTYPHALPGEHRLPPAPDRLAEALARWDVQAHRALASQPTAANLMLLAQTQTMITGANQVLLQAGALAGRLPEYHSRLSPALDAAHAAWAATARAWTELTPPSQRRPTAEMSAAAAEARAALREITHGPGRGHGRSVPRYGRGPGASHARHPGLDTPARSGSRGQRRQHGHRPRVRRHRQGPGPRRGVREPPRHRRQPARGDPRPGPGALPRQPRDHHRRRPRRDASRRQPRTPPGSPGDQHQHRPKPSRPHSPIRPRVRPTRTRVRKVMGRHAQEMLGPYAFDCLDASMAAVRGRSKRNTTPPGTPAVLLQGRVSVEARDAARIAADEAGISIAAYLEALVLADAEHRIVRRPDSPYHQESMTA